MIALPNGDYVRPEAVTAIRCSSDRVTLTLQPEGFIIIETPDPKGTAAQIAQAVNTALITP